MEEPPILSTRPRPARTCRRPPTPTMRVPPPDLPRADCRRARRRAGTIRRCCTAAASARCRIRPAAPHRPATPRRRRCSICATSAWCCARCCWSRRSWSPACCSSPAGRPTWRSALALGSALALPAVLAWLALACALQHRLARLGARGAGGCGGAARRGAAAASAGRCCGWAGGDLVEAGPWPAPAGRRSAAGLAAHAVAAAARPRPRCRPIRPRGWPNCSRASGRTSCSTP